MNTNSIDLLGVSESWLTADVPDSFIDIPGYNLFRADSPDNIRKHGVAVFVAKKYKVSQVPTFISNALVVYFHDFDLYVLNVYRPPSNNMADNDDLVNFILNFCDSREVLVLGDFNLPSLKWNIPDILQAYVSPLDLLFYNAFCSAGLTQVVVEPTIYPSGNILDLTFYSSEDRFGHCTVFPPFSRCSHCPVLVSYVFQNCSTAHNSCTVKESVRLWTKAKYDLIRRSY